jgi:hypothetical protein
VLKPASQTPGPALLLAAILDEAGLPKGALSAIPSSGADAERLAVDDRIAKLSFTGSMAVGWRLKELGWRRRVTLELGGNAAVIVEPDAGDLDAIARRIVGARLARRPVVHLGAAGPRHERSTSVCGGRSRRRGAAARHRRPPMNRWSAAADRRRQRRARRAVDADGGWRPAAACSPAAGVRLGRPPGAARGGAALVRGRLDEVFGPAAVLDPYEDFAQALNLVNDSRYGRLTRRVHAGHFEVQEAWARLAVGGIITTTSRPGAPIPCPTAA